MSDNLRDGKPPVLVYDHVTIRYNGIPAVRDVSFRLHGEEILGIVGESGSGKSTLIRAAMGLLGKQGLVTEGDIWFEGKDLPDISGEEMRQICGPKISMIFQDCGAALCPIRKIGDQLYEAMTEHTKAERADFNRQALDILKKLGLEDGMRALNSYPFELSGGMNQRMGIAFSLLMHPQILLADEPTSALDVRVQKQVIGEMLTARRLYHTAIILVTHNIGVVRAMADTVLVLKDGTVREFGEAKQVLNHPQDEYTRELLSAVPRLKRQSA